MIEKIDGSMPLGVTTPLSRTGEARKKGVIDKSKTVSGKMMVSMLDKLPKSLHAETIKQLHGSLPVPHVPINKSDVNNIKNKLDPNISLGVFFELLQQFMMWLRKSTRTEFLEERDLYKQEMNKAADDIRSAAGFTMAAGIVGGALGIVASAVGIRGAIKAAKIDQASMGEIGEVEKGFKLKNLQEMETETQSIDTEQTTPKQIEAKYSVKDEEVSLNPQPKEDKIQTDVKTDVKDESKLENVQLTESQKERITSLRTIASNQAARVLQRSDIAKSLLTSGGQVISGSMEFSSGTQRAQQVQEEALAASTGSFAEQQTQLYAQAGESMSKLQQKLSSIIESDIEARRTIIRS